MYIFVMFAFLFAIGSFFGWGLEVFYRRFFSAANPDRKWINPGFLNGPCLPLYGFSLCSLFALSLIDLSFVKNFYLRQIILFIIMALFITFIEYIAGLIFIKKMKIKLWDYSNQWGNIKGIICPKFTLYWAILAALYYFVIHPRIISALIWLSKHLLFSFFIGFYFGVIALDFWYSMNLSNKIREFAMENEVVIRYENLKAYIKENSKNPKFLLSFSSDKNLTDDLRDYFEKERQKIENLAENIKKAADEAQEKINTIKDNFNK